LYVGVSAGIVSVQNVSNASGAEQDEEEPHFYNDNAQLDKVKFPNDGFYAVLPGGKFDPKVPYGALSYARTFMKYKQTTLSGIYVQENILVRVLMVKKQGHQVFWGRVGYYKDRTTKIKVLYDDLEDAMGYHTHAEVSVIFFLILMICLLLLMH